MRWIWAVALYEFFQIRKLVLPPHSDILETDVSGLFGIEKQMLQVEKVLLYSADQVRSKGRGTCWDRKASGSEGCTPVLYFTRKKTLLKYPFNTVITLEFPALLRGVLRICEISSWSKTECTAQENVYYYTTGHKRIYERGQKAKSKARNFDNSLRVFIITIWHRARYISTWSDADRHVQINEILQWN